MAENTGKTTMESNGKTTTKSNGKTTTKSPTCREKILAYLAGGRMQKQKILEEVSGSDGHIEKTLEAMFKEGELARPKQGVYELIRDPLERTARQNAITINRLLNLYDRVLERYMDLIEIELEGAKDTEKKPDFLNEFKSLVSTIDTLMKRWYLVHRGYDSNSRQAVEDAKKKTRKAEKEELANAPLEERIAEVAHYDPIMKEIWDNLPKEEQEKKAV